MAGNLEYYAKAAESMGFARALLYENTGLRGKPELRALCNPEQCPKFGTNWVCPPGCGPLEECQDNLDAHKQGLLVQSVTEIDVNRHLDKLEELSKEHNQRVKKLAARMRRDGLKVLPLTTGGCIVCEECAFPAPCRNPDTRMHSLSAYGIDVGALCEAAGLPFAFRGDQISYYALLLT